MGYQQDQIDLDLPQRRLATYASARQIPCIDLLPHLRLCEQPPYERNARQWNAEGAAVATRTVSGWLQSRYANALPAPNQLTAASRR